MKRFEGAVALTAVLFGLVASGGCVMFHPSQVRGSGTMITETREVGEFNRVENRGEADLTIRIGEPASVTIEADDNLMPLITTEVSKEKLVISGTENLHSPKGIKVRITTPALEGVTITGSGNVVIPEIEGDSLDLVVRGSGDIEAAGRVERLGVKIQGSGDIDLGDLVTKSANASIAGSGDISLHVEEELNASIAGSGDIRYAGDPPKVNRRIAGSGEIHPR